jgi:chromosome partitioning protein
MTKVICLFNNKGGVGKTTITFHLGWKMAQMGKRVLIVDADPQCNLTGVTLGINDYQTLFDFYDSKRNTDIFTSLEPVFFGGSSGSRWGSPTQTQNENLFILAGNVRFSELDKQIGTAITSSRNLPVLENFVGAISKMVRDMAKQGRFDIVLIDMSPSISATNQSILMGCDYFIIPVSPDFYCYQAMDSLSRIFPDWASELADFRNPAKEYALPSRLPRMLGFISSNYRVYTTERNRSETGQKTMSLAYREWLKRIKSITSEGLVPSLQKKNMIISENTFTNNVSYDHPYHLAGIQDFNQLIPVSQDLSKPMYELTAKDGGWGGAVWAHQDKNGEEQGLKISVQNADKMFADLAESVFGIIRDDRD